MPASGQASSLCACLIVLAARPSRSFKDRHAPYIAALRSASLRPARASARCAQTPPQPVPAGSRIAARNRPTPRSGWSRTRTRRSTCSARSICCPPDQLVRRAREEGVRPSDELVPEIAGPAPARCSRWSRPRRCCPPGTTLPDRLPADRAPDVLKALASSACPGRRCSTGASRGCVAIDLSLLPLLKLGYDPASGPESVLTAGARQPRARSRGLKRPATRSASSPACPQPTQVAFLESTLEELPKAAETMDRDGRRLVARRCRRSWAS